MNNKKTCLFLVTVVLVVCSSFTWGFYAHKKINRLAVFTLPGEMIGFYKHYIQYITENAINPDRRRYAVEGEAAKHYIDIDVFGDSAIYNMPRSWNAAKQQYTEDTLRAYGIVPWNVNWVRLQLTDAFILKDVKRILRLSADLGHYLADANVPLHTTENYNGQLTGQHGIHGFWESRTPEVFGESYNYFVGKANYLQDPQNEIWKAVTRAHLALDSVLSFEKELTDKFDPDKKYSFEQRGGTTVKVYSRAFTEAYHKRLDGMVERQMLFSIKMVGDFWYTCWVDAGQPDLDGLIGFQVSDEELEKRKKELDAWKQKKFEGRGHDH